jgi:hypothetical protein
MELDQDKDLTPAESGYAGLETEISSSWWGATSASLSASSILRE